MTTPGVKAERSSSRVDSWGPSGNPGNPTNESGNVIPSRLVSADDDDFDFDFTTSKMSSRELSDLLDEVKPKPAAPDHAEPAGTVAPFVQPPRSDTNVVPPPTGSHDVSASAGDAEEPSPLGIEYGLPGGAPWALLAYAYRVLGIATRAKERAVLLERDLDQSSRVLDEAHASLGRAIKDAADLHGFALPSGALAEIETILEEAQALAASRAEISKKASRDNAMATARRESAAASLDPVEAEQERSRAALEACEHELEAAKGALAVAEARSRSVSPDDIDAFRTAGAALEDARESFRLVEARHRDAAQAYADARRRALLQLSRIAEAETAVEGARVEEKKKTRDLRRQQEEMQNSLREAYARLGELVFDRSLGPEYASGAFASVRRARDSRSNVSAQVERLRDLAHAYDAEAYRKGELGWYAVLGAVVLLLIVVAALA